MGRRFSRGSVRTQRTRSSSGPRTRGQTFTTRLRSHARGAAELTAAKTRALASVDNAQRARFRLASDDLSVRDTLGGSVQAAAVGPRICRRKPSRPTSARSRPSSAATDQSVASKLTAIYGGIQRATSFREAPFPQEPPPPQIPFPPYEPKVWGACAARGADPNKGGPHLQPGPDQRRVSTPCRPATAVL